MRRALKRATAGAERVLLAPLLSISPGLVDGFREEPNVVSNPSGEELKTIRTGVTEAFCGVASTGSVCVSLEGGTGGLISMLTRVHVVLLDARTIVPRPGDLSPRRGAGKPPGPGSFTFITGPSATADMGPLVRGVHGPGRLHIIILE